MSRRLVKLGCVLIGLQLLFLGKPAIGGDENNYLTITIKRVPIEETKTGEEKKTKLEVTFADQRGEIKPEGPGFDASAVADAKWADLGSISLIAVEKSPLKVWFTIGDTDYCFEFDDNGHYVGRCN